MKNTGDLNIINKPDLNKWHCRMSHPTKREHTFLSSAYTDHSPTQITQSWKEQKSYSVFYNYNEIKLEISNMKIPGKIPK